MGNSSGANAFSIGSSPLYPNARAAAHTDILAE
jgi:hypothetical protein